MGPLDPARVIVERFDSTFERDKVVTNLVVVSPHINGLFKAKSEVCS
jgi:hypothetical protein